MPVIHFVNVTVSLTSVEDLGPDNKLVIREISSGFRRQDRDLSNTLASVMRDTEEFVEKLQEVEVRPNDFVPGMSVIQAGIPSGKKH